VLRSEASNYQIKRYQNNGSSCTPFEPINENGAAALSKQQSKLSYCKISKDPYSIINTGAHAECQ
jgi:hypothetical protein